MSKKILFIHQNFPGQFPHIADALVARGDKVVAIGSASAKPRQGVTLVQWRLPRGTTTGIFDPATRAEADLLRADAAARKAWELKAKGFVPDLIIGHPGWGETIHISEVFPGVPQIAFGEFFYKSSGADVGFDKEFEKNDPTSDMRVHAKNLGMALSYSEADVIVCPTAFQASTLPKGLRHRIRVFHEGVDISNASRKSDATFKLPNGRVLDGSKPVITFINRNFERLRGFHVFMRALPAFLDRCPEAEVLLIGRDDGKGYGAPLPGGKTWKGVMLEEVGDRLDMGRVHFTGRVTHDDMIAAMSISWAHVYYTYPFVLSWSLVEAMACECLILGSDTAPVRDAITHGENGVLNDFFDVDALSNAMAKACREPEAFAALRPRARETALKMFDHKAVGVPAWIDLIDEMLASR